MYKIYIFEITSLIIIIIHNEKCLLNEWLLKLNSFENN